MTHEHLDIFSGIGGFAIAAQEAGFRTVAFCESDARCRAFLEKRWGLPVEPDIRKLDGRKWAGVSLVTGGPPCQPASRAGKQGGADDNRWLWPEALRVLEEAKPDCVVFENPLGIGDLAEFGILPPVGSDGSAIGNIGDVFNHSGRGKLNEIVDQIEALGYETQIVDIPACAVDSPQLRHRYWIVGFLVDAERSERWADTETRGCTQPGKHGQGQASGGAGQRGSPHLADTERERREFGSEQSACQPARNGRPGFAGDRQSDWQNSIWVPCSDGKLRRAPDDSFMLVDGLHRSLLGALGNAIVPQVATQILKAVQQQLK